MTTIAGNKGAIGYVSLGSLNDTVKAVAIDGADATVDAIKAGEYKVARPFNIAVKDGLSDAASDFIKFIMSEDGQKVVEDNGYISQGNEGAYTASGLKAVSYTHLDVYKRQSIYRRKFRYLCCQ